MQQQINIISISTTPHYRIVDKSILAVAKYIVRKAIRSTYGNKLEIKFYRMYILIFLISNTEGILLEWNMVAAAIKEECLGVWDLCY